MTLTLPDDPALSGFTEPDLRLELACGLFASGAVARGVAARVAGLDRAAFDEALFARHIPTYTAEMLDEDTSASKALFPG
jgi:predicted HTH domain antitoxin